jgi:hypothetical protein
LLVVLVVVTTLVVVVVLEVIALRLWENPLAVEQVPNRL